MPVLRRQRHAGLCEVQATLDVIVRSRPSGNPISEDKNEKEKENCELNKGKIF